MARWSVAQLADAGHYLCICVFLHFCKCVFEARELLIWHNIRRVAVAHWHSYLMLGCICVFVYLCICVSVYLCICVFVYLCFYAFVYL